MNDTIKTKRFNSRLPATPCTEEMDRAIRDEADRLDMKIAEFQRFVFDFFLTANAKKFGEKCSENPQETIMAAN